MLTFPCPICEKPMDVKETKTKHLHLRCPEPCGLNMFVNEAEGIEGLKALAETGKRSQSKGVSSPAGQDNFRASTVAEIKALKAVVSELKGVVDSARRPRRLTRREYEEGRA